MKQRWPVIPLVVVLALIVLLYRGLALDPSHIDSPLVGQPVPRFQLPALDGGDPVDHTAFAGRVSLLNVWASWCVSCRAEHDILVALARQHPELQLIGLNYKDESAAARGWLQRLGDPYRVSAVDADGLVGIDWGVYGVPETFVVDRQGVIVAKKVGPLTWEYVREELLPLIEELRS